MNRASLLLVITFLLVGFFFLSCSTSSSHQTSQTPLALTNASAKTEADRDVSLGALPKKGEVEAEKRADELESESEASRALGETRKKEMQEELQHIQRSIIDFDKTQKQINE